MVRKDCFTCEEKQFTSPCHLAIEDFHSLVVIDRAVIAESVREHQMIGGVQGRIRLVRWRQDCQREAGLGGVKFQARSAIGVCSQHTPYWVAKKS